MAGEQARPVRMDWRGRRDRPLVAPGELLSIYQPVIGSDATLAWLNLAFALQEVGVIPDPIRELEIRQGLSRESASLALARLEEVRLLEASSEGGVVLKEPATRGELAARGYPWQERLGDEGSLPGPTRSTGVQSLGTGADRPPAPDALPVTEALQAVVDFYHQRIGLLGPVQYDKLRFWVEEKEVSPDVVAAAIEETAASAENPRIQYLEGILRNWYNDGVRTLQDLMSRHHAAQSLGTGRRAEGPREQGSARFSGGVRPARRPRADGGGGQTAAPANSEGLPNAAAYRAVDPADVRRWKALHPEEYGKG